MKEEQIIEGMVDNFQPLTEQEQEIVLKGLALTYIECLNNAEKSKRKNTKRLWLIQAQTYESIINLLTENKNLLKIGFNHKRVLLKALDDLWKDRYGESHDTNEC